MSQSLSNYDEALKIDYLPVIREQLNMKTILMNRIVRNERDFQGKRWNLTAHVSRNAGIGARPDAGTLPTAGQQAYLNPYDVTAYNYGRINLTGPVMKASRNDKGAIARALETEIKGVTRDLKKDINYQLFNDGTSRRCLINGDPGSEGTTMTVDSPGTKYLFEGMIIDIIADDSGVATDTDVTISSINSDTECTTTAIDTGVADNDWVIMANTHDGAGITPSDSYEMMGLKGIVDDNTYVDTLHNLSRGSYAWWKCSTHSNDDNSGTNRDVTLDLMQASLTAVEKNAGETDLIVTTPDLRDAYAALLVADKRFVNTLDLDGGFKGLEYSGLPLVADPDCTENTMYFLDTSHLQIMQMSDFDWMDEDGAVLARVSGSDAYEAVLFWYAELATDRPRAFSFLRDVQ